ncbi:hypothetical protein GAP52_074 [Cronobacter phage vB_CsaP_GAP52]|uniref:Uncharacterized protein n=1 Tax=Cronobacter phage vB_CsaP_GAP52 TaxID=1141137 RepID=K4F7G8_9CAUD|nr:hypothetical protein D858_gp040 [Cronobacter phage vB_CsaP_GAP52]AFC22068.1 hypothetical protein GAP52_074 [Cronobacter phage vB_CsaP_GAP52]
MKIKVTLCSGIAHEVDADNITTDPSWVVLYKKIEKRETIVAIFPAHTVAEVINQTYVKEVK